MMKISKTIKSILGFSPYLELMVRYIYWNNIGWFSNSKSSKRKIHKTSTIVDFNNVIGYLQSFGIRKGDLILVHSAYRELKCTQKSPSDIIALLKDFIGDDGTLAMPAIRKYEGEPDAKNYLKVDLSGIVFNYNVYSSEVQTGILPSTMVGMEESVVSRFPLNTLVALGPLAKPMMENNLVGDLPTACGENSSWKFCLDHDAYLIGLGTDLAGCLTMIHTAEDILDEKWPIKNWYRERIFKIQDKDFETLKAVRERQPKWGSLHWAGRTLRKDLLKNNILITRKIDGILVEIIKAKELITFLNSRNSKGYPYYFVRRHLK